MNSLNVDFLSMQQATGMYLHNTSRQAEQAAVTAPDDFQEILRGKIEQNVKFSKHANERLEHRNIALSKEQLSRLNQGIYQARDKQIQESLVMLDNLAFIVNVKNNIVVTAMEQGESGQVFTNIDGAVIV